MPRTNRPAIARIGWIIARMRKEAKKRDAAVYRAESATKETPFTILVFTMLSSRTKDEATMVVAGRLFREAKTPSRILALGRKGLEKILYGVGFHRNKAKNLLETCRMLDGRGGEVPGTQEGLLELPGVGRKTANIVLARAFGKAALGVDVHVHRISNRLGIVRTKNPEDSERELVKIVPARLLRTMNRDFVAFGQTVCLPRNPKCGECPVGGLCWRSGVRLRPSRPR